MLYRVSLQDLAELMMQYGAVDAINLDGGGSATFVVNNTLVNYPSDTWLVTLVIKNAIYLQFSLYIIMFKIKSSNSNVLIQNNMLTGKKKKSI